MKVLRRTITVRATTAMLTGLGAGAANAVKPAQGDEFTPGTCTTTTGQGANAVQTTDPGQCGSADNQKKHTEEDGINTGGGFKPHPGRG